MLKMGGYTIFVWVENPVLLRCDLYFNVIQITIPKGFLKIEIRLYIQTTGRFIPSSKIPFTCHSKRNISENTNNSETNNPIRENASIPLEENITTLNYLNNFTPEFRL